jgi:molecular chaperone Hsp33
MVVPKSSSAISNDFLLGFYLGKAFLQGRFLRLEKTLNTILGYHSYPSIVAYLLAEALNIAAILIAHFKSEGRITLQIKGNGLIKLLVVDATNKGDLRAYADYHPSLKDQPYSFRDLMGNGILVVTLDQGEYTSLFQGIVALEGNSITESIVHYFHQSVQQEICLLIEIQQDEQKKWRSSALFLQKNAPKNEDEEEQWRYSQLLFSTIQKHELLNFNQSATNFLFKVFHEQEIYFQPSMMMKAYCRCSKEKIQRFAEQLTNEDNLKENGRLEIRCEFCNTSYSFTE